MDIAQNKNTLKVNTSAGGSGDSGDKGYVTFGPLEVPREKLISELFYLHGLTQAPDFENAIQLSWHKVIGNSERERIAKLVTFYRLWQDGRSRPPFDFAAEYRRISGAPDLSFAPRPK